MCKNLFKSIAIIALIIAFSCAKRGSITGGLKDTLAPIMIQSLPKNLSTNFNGKIIILKFDEYVKLKDVSKQLIVSPPMKNQLEILPQSATKEITIKIKDTLQPNTTYSFNFGNSIQDNNENNPLKQFKYVFSTGKQLDSLVLNAKTKDAINKKVDNFVSIMLYEVTDKYTDSIVFKEVPRYITNTLDSLKLVKLENLKQGKYRLIAIKDLNGNNKFDLATDKIGFQKEFVKIPNDTLYELELFKQEIPFKAKNSSQLSGSKLLLGYEGNAKDIKITVKKDKEIFPVVVTQFPKKDSVLVWVKAQKNDSLTVLVSKNKYEKQFSYKFKNQKKDTLRFTPVQTDVLPLREKFTINATTPLSKFDNSKMVLLNKDSVAIKFTTEYDNLNQELKFNFSKEPLEKYKLKIFPGAITDFFDKKNDTLIYKFSTKNSSDYGNLRVELENVKRFPVIVEITDKDGKVIASEYSDKKTALIFDLIDPAIVTLRLIYDDNKNKIWDSGNFIELRQAEEVIYFSKQVDVRANWDVVQPFDLKSP